MNVNPLSSSQRKRDDDDIIYEKYVKNGKSSRASSSPSRRFRFSLTQIILVVVMLAAIGAAGYFYYQYSRINSNPSQALDEQSKRIKDSVGKLMDLYDYNDLSVASITNIDSLKQQNPEFYQYAKNGNYILLSQKRAILYDADRNMVLNVSPVINDTTTPTDTVTPTPVATTQPVTTTTPVKK